MVPVLLDVRRYGKVRLRLGRPGAAPPLTRLPLQLPGFRGPPGFLALRVSWPQAARPCSASPAFLALRISIFRHLSTPASLSSQPLQVKQLSTPSSFWPYIAVPGERVSSTHFLSLASGPSLLALRFCSPHSPSPLPTPRPPYSLPSAWLCPLNLSSSEPGTSARSVPTRQGSPGTE